MSEWIFARLLWLYPSAFRERYRDELLAFFRQDRHHPKYGSGALRPIRFWRATVGDLVRASWSHRHAARRESAMSTPKATRSSRWLRDLRFAWRGLWAAPGVALAALAVLVVGIGASTAIFSVVDAVVLRGLPYREPGALLHVAINYGKRPAPMLPQDFFDLRARQASFASLGASFNVQLGPTIDEPVVTVFATRVTASLFETLGVAPARGRAFAASDEQVDAPAVAIISDRFWRSRFHADPGVAGRTIRFKSAAVTVIGVMPPGFMYPVRPMASTVDVWLPLVATPAMTTRATTRNYSMTVVGRPRPGTSPDQVSAELSRIRDGIVAENPGWLGEDQTIVVRRYQDTIVISNVRSWMLLLLGAVAGVLLIACLNVANLLVARAVTRGPELAVRAALGASRWDLSRVLLLESLLLSVMGGVGGILAAFWGVDLLRATLPGAVPRLASVAVDLRVMAVALSASAITGIVFGVLPALHASRPDVVALARQGGRSQSASRASRRIRTVLMVGEVAVAAVLVAGSGLFLASFARVSSVDLGFDPRHVVTFFGSVMDSSALTPPASPKARESATINFSLVGEALARIRAVPGVVAADAMQGGGPLERSWVSVEVQHADRQSAPFSGPEAARVRAVGPRYLEVIRGTMLRGRWVSDTDVDGAPPVVVLSEEAARRYFESRNPVGQTILMEGYARQVIGVTTAIRWAGPESDRDVEVFIPFAQTSYGRPQLVVRTTPDPVTLMPALTDAIRTVMPDVASDRPAFLERAYSDLLAQRKFNMIVLAIFGVVAIVVAAIGIYGLMAFVVAQRRREIGVRVALGAAPFSILQMILRSATTLMAVGLAIGLGASLLLEQTIRAFLFNPAKYDPFVYGLVALLLFAAGLAAALGPARRAARVDPLIALRGD